LTALSLIVPSSGNATPPPGRTEPITNLGTASIDIGHRLKSHAADGATINDDGEREWRVGRRNASDVILGIGALVRMGEEIA
jgi:hypothetical protein